MLDHGPLPVSVPPGEQVSTSGGHDAVTSILLLPAQLHLVGYVLSRGYCVWGHRLLDRRRHGARGSELDRNGDGCNGACVRLEREVGGDSE